MKQHTQKYLRQIQNSVNGQLMSANGQRQLGADGWLQRHSGFTQDAEAGNFFPANGGAPAQASYSQPYIVTVSNASAAAVADFDIWGAILYLNNSQYTFTNGNLTISGVTLSSGAPAPVTYYNMLQSSNTDVFTIGKTTLQVISGPSTQITQPWTIKTFSMNGNFARKLLPNVISPTQYQTGVIDNYMQYDIDGSTSLGLNILASAVFQMFFYPLANISLSRSLVGQQSAKTFAPPPSNLPPTVVVQQ